MRTAVVATVVLVLVAGCSGSGGGSAGTPTVETPPSDAATHTLGPGPTASTPVPPPSATSTLTKAAGPDNPWGRAPVVVAVHDREGTGRDYERQVRRAVQYWEGTGAGYATWEPNFTVRPDASDPDVVIQFVDEVRNCDYDFDDAIVGCASVLRPGDTPRDPEVVRVDGNLSDYGTFSTVRHELGHVLGLEHGDEPEAVMAHSTAAVVGDGDSNHVTVHIEVTEDIVAEDSTRRQATRALDYYESGAGGWLEENVTFEVVDDPNEADVRIVFLDGDLDGSEAFISEGLIRVDVQWPDTRGWHVGYWLGFYFGAESAEDLPEPFDEPRFDDRREWW